MAWGAGNTPASSADLEFVPAEQDGAIQSGVNAGGFCAPRAPRAPTHDAVVD